MSASGIYQKAQFYLRAPTKAGRARFSIAKRYRNSKTSSETVESEKLDAINRQYISGKLTFSEAKAACQLVLKELRVAEEKKVPSLSFRKANKTIVDDYWEKEYSIKDLRCPASAYNRLIRAIKVIGDLPLVSASQADLQAAINKTAKKFKGTKRATGKNQREVVAALRQLLKFIGRTDVRLVKWHKPINEVRHLTLDEFKLVAAELPTLEMKILAWLGFSTGGRVGELFGLRPENFNPKTKTVYIPHQMMADGSIEPTKNRKKRHVRILDEGIPWLKKWFKIDPEQKAWLRNQRHAEILTVACKAIYPKQTTKHLVFHDLRHSYAIYLLHKEIPMELVAKSLGDSILVCQEYYTGFTLTDQGIAAINSYL